MPHPYPPPGQPPWSPYAAPPSAWPGGPGWSPLPPAWPGRTGWVAQPPARSGGPGWSSLPPAWSGGPAWGSQSTWSGGAGWGAQPPAWSGGPVWSPPPPAWPGGPAWGAQPPAWQAADPYPSPGWSYAPEPVVVEWTAILEPALDAVLPAIQGLLEISGQILGSLPAALDIPATSSGMGHVGLFGAAEAGDPDDGEERAEA